jgi:mevalonate pyrophosphate decarboxylase
VTLELPAAQPADDMGRVTAAEAMDAGPSVSVIATVVTMNGVVVQLGERPDGSLVLSPNGNRMPLCFDRYQRAAVMAALRDQEGGS